MKEILYDLAYEESYPLENQYYLKYSTVPSLISTGNKKIDIVFITYLEAIGFKKIWSFSKIGKTDKINTKFVFEDEVEKVLVSFHTKDEYNNTGKKVKTEGDYMVKIFYSEYTDYVQRIEKRLQDYILIDNKGGKISLITQDYGGLSTTDFHLDIEDIDIALNYGKDFVKVHERIVDKLCNDTSENKGIVMLYGDPGTGKTSYIKYLAKLIKKDILFIPPNLTEGISSPGFISFLLEHSNSILIIEDGEKVISDRDSNEGSMGVSNILNISDGILGSCLNIQVIVTFNTKREKIDKALLRKGRLIAEHKFGPLSVEESNILLEHLGKKVKTDVQMTLTDIYNYDEESFTVSPERTNIGFGR
jgi:hypothetical protein